MPSDQFGPGLFQITGHGCTDLGRSEWVASQNWPGSNAVGGCTILHSNSKINYKTARTPSGACLLSLLESCRRACLKKVRMAAPLTDSQLYPITEQREAWRFEVASGGKNVNGSLHYNTPGAWMYYISWPLQLGAVSGLQMQMLMGHMHAIRITHTDTNYTDTTTIWQTTCRQFTKNYIDNTAGDIMRQDISLYNVFTCTRT